MAIINQLSSKLANLIAAGEVVERPGGIVKELIENSIDAKATRIDINTTNGGLLKIVVSDNGCGMDKEDAVMCFQRHATSKLNTSDDLWSITSLGFRGEALPSIAAVSKVQLTTNSGEDGYIVTNDYGEIIDVSNIACNKGTSISVSNLFYKTPARLKYLKSENYELAIIQDIVNKFALGNPNISFRLINNNKEIIKTSGLNNLSEVVSIIYGKDCYKNAFKFDFEDYDYKVSGIALLPQINRANKNYIHTFINSRMIKSFRLNKAIVSAYNSYMDHSRYPIVIINILMDEKLVDVNVHPSKWEVRLSKQAQLEYLITEGLKKALDNVMRANYVTTTKLSTDSYFKDENTANNQIKQPIDNINSNNIIKQDFETITPIKYESNDKTLEYKINEQNNTYQQDSFDLNIKIDNQQLLNSDISTSFPNLQLIGQMHGKYIICNSDEGLYIIDQHAAQERYNYERIQKLLNTKSIKTDLLIPLTFNASSMCINQLVELNEYCKAIDIEFEQFSNTTIIVRSVPIWMNDLDETIFLQDVLDMFKDVNDISKIQLNKDKIATMACHSSIRFNRFLTHIEMQKVIDDLKSCTQPFNCPHGRPTFIHISEQQLIKDFKR